jgi:spermidine synthase
MGEATTARTYNQDHASRKYSRGHRRVSVYVAWSYPAEANRDVLTDPRVVVYVDDGRQHLRMRGESPYDLVVLEPPPIAQAGVGALYSREFYALARGRLSPKGYISQWLPAYQVPADTTLAMIRAFVDVFPQAVLLCGANQELLLVGTNDSRIEIDPNRLAKALADAPAVQSDLRRVGLGTITEIVGTFVGSARTLHDATRGQEPVTVRLAPCGSAVLRFVDGTSLIRLLSHKIYLKRESPK